MALSFESFEHMNLDPKLLHSIKTQGFTKPTEIQEKAIPIIIEGKDLLATAETGSGKTAAFMLPILTRLLQSHQPERKNSQSRGPRVLILAPTRELVDQIQDCTRIFGKNTQIKFGTVIGGVSYYHQEQLLKKPLDILIATPGRLLDHMRKGRIDYSRLELLVLDEADRMLDMGFRSDIETVCKAIPSSQNHQTLLFSATLNQDIQKIAKQLLKDPVHLELARKAKPHALISQQIHQVDDYRHKCSLLFHILEDQNVWQAIVFTKTKRGAEQVADELKTKQIACAPLHGDMKQGQRSRTIDRMHKGELRVLVATDAAGRGLDIKKLTHVLNFDLPSNVEDYIHRIGRTGRSGEHGTAISLVDSSGWSLIARIEKMTGQRLERRVISGLEPKKGRGESRNSHSEPRSRYSESRGRSSETRSRFSESRNGKPRTGTRTGNRNGNGKFESNFKRGTSVAGEPGKGNGKWEPKKATSEPRKNYSSNASNTGNTSNKRRWEPEKGKTEAKPQFNQNKSKPWVKSERKSAENPEKRYEKKGENRFEKRREKTFEKKFDNKSDNKFEKKPGVKFGEKSHFSSSKNSKNTNTSKTSKSPVRSSSQSTSKPPSKTFHKKRTVREFSTST